MKTDLDALTRELGAAAERLRSGELEPAEAAAEVERCAELAGRLGAELERAARAAEREAPPESQERLL
ncbi:MAG: hypothetical protein ACR2GL_00170 [Thermoleophilaceae bacterium]